MEFVVSVVWVVVFVGLGLNFNLRLGFVDGWLLGVWFGDYGFLVCGFYWFEFVARFCCVVLWVNWLLFRILWFWISDLL